MYESIYVVVQNSIIILVYGFNECYLTVEEKKERTIKSLTSAQEQVSQEILDLREKIQLAKETVAKFKSEIGKYQTDMTVDMADIHVG